ncbi:MAG: DNA-directed RNA polymerase subunit alpha [Clostridia bacterium]|nr:DNA-directed RNA polymerase subunit alpha [Clostridia bacterium]MBP5269758.1 DNA-directed RNA polymerase subunit alpha [Clostridia bacterium]
MTEIQKPNISVSEISADGRVGHFVIEPLERGFGTTLGNSLRRVMLSSLRGVAVTSIKVDGVLHEFSAIPGVVEDLTEIVLNVKGIVAKLHTPDQAAKVAVLDVQGPGEATAGMIRQDSDIEILNPDHHIATLAADGHLVIEFTFESGRGYVSQDKNKILHSEAYGNNASAPIGLIYTDSIYTPVYNVSYTVENTRVGSNITDFDRLTLDVTTNGTINAREAISLGAKILNDHLNIFVELTDEAKNAVFVAETPERDRNRINEMTVEDLDLSVRSTNCLRRAGIETVGDMVSKTEDELIKIRHLGKKCLEEITAKLASLGLSLRRVDE